MKLLKETKNQDVIDLFVTNLFPKDKKPQWGTKHLYITKVSSGWALKNYNTYIAYRPDENPNVVYVNTDRYSVTTTIIQNKIKNTLSDHNIETKIVEEDQLNAVIEGRRSDHFRSIDSVFNESTAPKMKNLLESFFAKEKEFLVENHEAQVLKDTFTKFISFAGFPTIVNSKTFLKGIMYLIDKWTSFINNKDVAEPEDWEDGSEEFNALAKEKNELEDKKDEFDPAEAEELSDEAGSMIVPSEEEYPKKEEPIEESESAENLKILKEDTIETIKPLNLYSVFRTPSTNKNVIQHSKNFKESYKPGKVNHPSLK